VRRNNVALGRLLVSKGNIEWKPKNDNLAFRLSWKDFDVLMQEAAMKRRG
jgi:hypothetical protein